MGQTSSQEIQQSPVSPVKKSAAPPRPDQPPKLQPVSRPPSYAVPENKVLPTELPSKPLRSVSSPFSTSPPEYEDSFVDKENKPLETEPVNLDHNFFPKDTKTVENTGDKSDVISVKGREKYKAPSPPSSNTSPVNSPEKTENIFLDPFYNRAALAHRRSHSLDRLPSSRVNGHARRPVSAVNLTASEHTIFEDPEEANQNNKYTSLPQKNTFPLDYSYAVTYAQLAEHRRKKAQPKLDAEKELLLKRQSLPELGEQKSMDPNIDMYLTRDGEIDLDNLTPKRRKYRAPAPPTTQQASKHAVVLHTQSSGSPGKTVYIPVSRHQKWTAPSEPPVDYDTGEATASPADLQKQSLQQLVSPGPQSSNVSPGPLSSNVSPVLSDMKVTRVQARPVETLSSSSKVTQSSSPVLILKRQSSGAEPISPTSPKSPPPPVKPKPVRSPDEGRFMFPNIPSKVDTDIVTVNGQVIPELPKQAAVHKELVSLSIDCQSESIRAAVVPVSIAPVESNLEILPDRNGNGVPESQTLKDTKVHVHPIQRENRRTIHLSSEGKSETVSGVEKSSTDLHVPTKQNSGVIEPHNTVIIPRNIETELATAPSVHEVRHESQAISTEAVTVAKKVNGVSLKNVSEGSDMKPIPVGLTTDIILDSSSVCESNPPTVPQSQSGSDSGVTMPLSDQSFESLTTGDRSMEMDVVMAGGHEPEVTADGQVSQGTMTMTPPTVEDRAPAGTILHRSLSASSSDSAKPVSPPLTPDDNQPPKMSSLLQNDIVAAAQVRVLNLRKPIVAPARPKNPEELFKEELAKIHKERKVRITRNLSLHRDAPCSGAESDPFPPPVSTPDGTADKDNDSGIQACSFSEDWTPEHDLEDSDDDNRSALTSRSGFFYDGRKAKTPVKTTNSISSNGRVRVLRKSDSDASDKFGSLRRFRQNVHKSVKHALSSVNRPSSKPTKLDKRSSLPPPVTTTAEPKQPVFRKLDPDAAELSSNNGDLVSEGDTSSSHTETEHNTTREDTVSDSDQKVLRKAGVAYVSGNGQIVLLPEFETVKSSSKKDVEDGHRAPKRWKKMKKFAYMATTRRKEKQKMEQLLRDRVEEQERRMEAERQKQMEMEREFMKVRQVDKPVVKALADDIDEAPVRNGNVSKTKSPREIPPTRPKEHQTPVTLNSTSQEQSNLNGPEVSPVTSFSMPGLVQTPGLLTTSQPTVNPIVITGNGQPYNPWLPAQPVQNLAYPAAMGWSLPNYGAVPTQYTATSLPYDLTNYMQMLDINGQSVNVPLNNGLVNGYTQSLDRNQTNGGLQYNGGVQYNGAPSYTVANASHLQQPNAVEANNYNNKRSLKQTIYVNPGSVDDSLFNQMYAEYQNGNRNLELSQKEKKKTSNPLYYSSDEEEEYEVRDVHSGHTHSKGTVARISVPDHHNHHLQYADEEMPSPSSVTSSSADSGTPPYPIKLNGSAPHHPPSSSSYFRSGSTSDHANLDESYSSADR